MISDVWRANLKYRMILTFAAFSVALSFFFWFLIGEILTSSEDMIFNQQVVYEAHRQQAYYHQHQQFDQLPLGMTLYNAQEAKALPFYPQLLTMTGEMLELEEENIHLSRSWIDDQPFYVIFNVDDQGFYPHSIDILIQLFLLAFLVVAIIGILFGAFIGTRITRPLRKLDSRVQQLGADGGEFGETTSFGQDEVGRLACSFSQTYNRMQQFLLREKRFTREVSHELRTPTAVISGALEILDLQPDNARALARIRKANNNVKQLIDTFLLLGREENFQTREAPIDLTDLCRELIQVLTPQARVPMNLRVNGEPHLYVEPLVVQVLINNLLTNAIRHTAIGNITLNIEVNRLTVSDTGGGFPEEVLQSLGQPYVEGSSNLGLGLSIVYRICEQFGWTLHITSDASTGSQVCIVFSETPS